MGSTSKGTPAAIPDSGGYLDPETGQWVVESSSRRSSRSSSPTRRQEEKTRPTPVKGHNNTQGGKKGRRKDRSNEWDLAKKVWGGGNVVEVATPVKKRKKKQGPSGSDNKENIPEDKGQGEGVRRSSREVKRVQYQELSEGSQSQSQ